MDKFEFMNIIKDVVSEIEVGNLDNIGKQMKDIIDSAIKLEKEYDKAGIR